MSVVLRSLSSRVRRISATHPHRSYGGNGQEGIGILEPMISIVILSIAVTVSANLLLITSRTRQQAYQSYDLSTRIDANLAAIHDQAARLTCCSGRCTIGIPNGIAPGVESVCATMDHTDDRYFFPQRDDASTTAPFPNTTEPREPYAVDQLCSSTSNLVVAPLVQKINAATSGPLVSPAGTNRVLAVRPRNLLQVTYTDSVTDSILRVEHILPPMVKHCS